MTSSSSSSPIKTRKLVILHGLNNNLSCFGPLCEALGTQFDVELIQLPGHGENREEAKDLATALATLNEKLKKFDDYYLIGFSTGALLSQLLIRSKEIKPPKAQVLLSPAFVINYDAVIGALLTVLPQNFFMKSFMPTMAKNRERLFIWEYRTLLEGIKSIQSAHFAPETPTHIVIDPQDELVNALRLKELTHSVRFKFWPRPYLKNNRGHHHLLFHPDYFRGEEWSLFLREITDFLNTH